MESLESSPYIKKINSMYIKNPDWILWDNDLNLNEEHKILTAYQETLDTNYILSGIEKNKTVAEMLIKLSCDVIPTRGCNIWAQIHELKDRVIAFTSFLIQATPYKPAPGFKINTLIMACYKELCQSSPLESSDTPLECVVCYEKTYTVTNCKHSLCGFCNFRVNNCPYCRNLLSKIKFFNKSIADEHVYLYLLKDK